MTRPTALTALLLLLAAVGAILFWPEATPATPPLPAPTSEPEKPAAFPETPVATPPGNSQTERRTVDEPARTVASVPRSSADSAQGVRGQVTDDRDRPIEGVQVSLLESVSNDPFGRFLNQNQSVPTLATAAGQTAADGTFALGLREPSARRFELCILAEGFATERLGELAVHDGEWTELGSIQLAPGCTIHGRVTVAGTDLPVPQATVWLESGDPFVDIGPAHLEGWQDRRAAVVGADGRYELRHAPRRGVFRLLASAPGFGRQIRDELELSGRGIVEQDFALPRGLSIASVRSPAMVASLCTDYAKARTCCRLQPTVSNPSQWMMWLLVPRTYW